MIPFAGILRTSARQKKLRLNLKKIWLTAWPLPGRCSEPVMRHILPGTRTPERHWNDWSGLNAFPLHRYIGKKRILQPFSTRAVSSLLLWNRRLLIYDTLWTACSMMSPSCATICTWPPLWSLPVFWWQSFVPTGHRMDPCPVCSSRSWPKQHWKENMASPTRSAALALA